MGAAVSDCATKAAGAVQGAGVPAVAHELRPGRARMLSVARQLFCSQGYDRTPLRGISDALGVTKAAVYYHFKAKDDLLVAIATPVLDRVEALVGAASGGPVLEGDDRRGFLHGYVDILSADGDVIALLFGDPAVADHPLGRRFAAQRERIRVLLGAEQSLPAGIRASTALRTLELAMSEFADAEPTRVRQTALDIALAVLDAGSAAAGHMS
jgi:AcrR family transcriptional regulator